MKSYGRGPTHLASEDLAKSSWERPTVRCWPDFIKSPVLRSTDSPGTRLVKVSLGRLDTKTGVKTSRKDFCRTLQKGASNLSRSSCLGFLSRFIEIFWQSLFCSVPQKLALRLFVKSSSRVSVSLHRNPLVKPFLSPLTETIAHLFAKSSPEVSIERWGQDFTKRFLSGCIAIVALGLHKVWPVCLYRAQMVGLLKVGSMA